MLSESKGQYLFSHSLAADMRKLMANFALRILFHTQADVWYIPHHQMAPLLTIESFSPNTLETTRVQKVE